MSTAIVLGAGGVVGQAFHLGVLTALAELTGFDARRADILVGTSAGSLVAAALAAELSASDQRAELLGEPLSRQGQGVRRANRPRARLSAAPEPSAAPGPSLRRPLAPGALLTAARRPFAVRPGALAAALLPPGRTSNARIGKAVAGLHGAAWPDRDLRVCAVRARDGRRVVFGTPAAPTTDVSTAVAASCAIPAYFAPVRIGEDAYVDGGVHSPTNADIVLADRPTLVVISSPMSGVLRPSADVGMRLAIRRYLAQEVRRLRRGGSDVVVFQPGRQDLPVMGANPMRGDRVPQVLAVAADSTRARLEARPDLVARLHQTRREDTAR